MEFLEILTLKTRLGIEFQVVLIILFQSASTSSFKGEILCTEDGTGVTEINVDKIGDKSRTSEHRTEDLAVLHSPPYIPHFVCKLMYILP